ncbi:MAG: hypothetical protein Q9220_001396 [cf. Caloplaca sp. 1 TL-2023]
MLQPRSSDKVRKLEQATATSQGRASQRLEILSSQLSRPEVSKMASFDGKVVIITGAASGIGRATAQLLASRGAAISIADVQTDALTATSDEIKKVVPDAKVLAKVVNVASAQEVDAWTQETVSQFGKIDGAANLAGIAGKQTGNTKIEDVEEAEFDQIISVNLKGVFNCLKAELKHMNEQGSGSIVNATSIAGIRGYPRAIGYCASKHAVVGMTMTAAGEYGDKNIRCNAIAPGPIDTPMMGGLTSGKPGVSDMSKGIISRVPMKRYGTAEEVAKLIAFLLSDESSFISGGVMTIDGALSS